jgi:hypothetical protein
MVHDRSATYPVSLTRSDRLLLHLPLPMQLLVAVPADDSKPPFVAVHNPSKHPAFTLASLPDAHLSLPYPLVLSPIAVEQFFEPARGFDPSSLLKNPLLLIGGLSAVLMLGLPYLTVRRRPSESSLGIGEGDGRLSVTYFFPLPQSFPLDAQQSQLDPELIKEAQEMIQPSSLSASAGKKAAPAPPAWGSSASSGGGGSVTAAAVVAGGPAMRAAAGGKKGKR